MNDTETTAEIVSLIDMQRDHVALGNRKRELPVQLTDAEWREYAERNADQWREQTTLKAVENSRRALFNAEHKARLAEHARVAGIVADKHEPRSVRVRDYGMAGPNEVCTVRVDTGEIIGRRAMTARERELVTQVPLAFPAGGDADTRAPKLRDAETEACENCKTMVGRDTMMRSSEDMLLCESCFDDMGAVPIYANGPIVAGSDLNAMENGEHPDGVGPHPVLGDNDFAVYLSALQNMEQDELIQVECLWEAQGDDLQHRDEALIAIGELLDLHNDHGEIEVAESHADDDLPPEA